MEHATIINYLTRDKQYVFHTHEVCCEERAAEVTAEAAKRGTPSYYLVPTNHTDIKMRFRHPYRRVDVEGVRMTGPGRSDREGLTLVQLLDMFPTEEAARAWFERIRWPNGRRCPHCKSERTSAVKSAKPMPYHCGDCRKYFSVKTGTVMQGSNLPVRKWALGIYLMSTSLKGVSSMKLHRDLGITQKTAWMMEHKIRQGWADGGPLSGTVEVDETYIGGKRKNMSNAHRKAIRETEDGGGRGGKGKAIVAAAKQRGGAIRAAPVSNTDRATMRGFVEDRVAPGSQLYTDEAATYERLPDLFNRYSHETVRHSVSEYVRGDVHTNGAESFWSMLKRGYHGTYHHWSAKHLARYVREFAGRHNVRDLDTVAQMSALALGMVGKRLRWQDLTA